MLRFTRRHLAAGATLALAASTFPLATTSFAQSADETAVAKAVDGLGKAMLAADKAQLEALLADKLSYGHSAGRIETKAEFLDIVAGKKTIYKSITLTEPSITVAGDHAIVRHIFAVETESGGKPATAKVGVMQVWVKEGGNWKLLARQAFRLAA